jgi:hypothetical protein
VKKRNLLELKAFLIISALTTTLILTKIAVSYQAVTKIEINLRNISAWKIRAMRI